MSSAPDLVLSPAERDTVRCIVRQNLPGAQCWVFGSRATGRARPFSDLDLLIKHPLGLSMQARMAVADQFEASALPFCVDLVEPHQLTGMVAQRVMQECVPL